MKLTYSFPSAGAVFAFAISVIAAIFAAAAFTWLRFPLPWMLGPLMMAAALSLSGFRLFGHAPGVPPKSREIFVPMVGIMIGSRVTPEFFGEFLIWWPSLLLIFPFMIIAQFMNAALLLKIGRYDRTTAFFAASPGGLIEAVLIGEQNGGNPALMSMQHFARISLAVTIIPILLSLYLGGAVGSAAGVVASGSDIPLTLRDIALLVFSAVVGVKIARKINLPAPTMVGPLLLSALFHATGITEAHIPPILLMTAQLFIGTTLGMQFTGPSKKMLIQGAGLSLITLSGTLVLSAGFAFIVSISGIAPGMVAFIAFAPGGLVEMGLIAVSLHADPVFVAAHHVVRIGLAVSLGPWLFKRFYRD